MIGYFTNPEQSLIAFNYPLDIWRRLLYFVSIFFCLDARFFAAYIHADLFLQFQAKACYCTYVLILTCVVFWIAKNSLSPAPKKLVWFFKLYSLEDTTKSVEANKCGRNQHFIETNFLQHFSIARESYHSRRCCNHVILWTKIKTHSCYSSKH